MRWNDDSIKTEILNAMNVLGIDRMPNTNELLKLGRNDLYLKILRTKKMKGWADELDLKVVPYKKPSIPIKSTKEYKRKRDYDYRKTINGLIKGIYQDQKKRCRQKKWQIGYTMSEFKQWMLEQPNLIGLHQKWVESGYNIKLVPSVDRINHLKRYEFGNIQLITFQENIEKAKKERPSKIVYQYDLDGNFIKSFPSVTQAQNETGIYKSQISKCALGFLKTSGGYTWRYENNSQGQKL